MSRKELREVILKVSEGTLEKLTDFLLWLFFLQGASLGKTKTSRDMYRIFSEAEEMLREVNYQSFKRAVDNLRKKKLLTWEKIGGGLEIEITKQGEERLEASLPAYQEKRTWDKKLYLVTYDIPEKRHRDRDILREYLKRIGCVSLQESVWLTPYNPTQILADFVRERELEGMILVSDLGPQGTVGGEDIKALVKRVYQLEEINERYGEFIEKYSRGNFPRTELTFAFYRILEDDPQLPFELLPGQWRGDEAYHLFKKLTYQANGRMGSK
ncbi:CRISPR-associated endonuclease Cas2 [Candidatus Shapirobacteria bacterium]|nr:CRISPR-associated endonuclease Cas2 [Candidatus Shapirobacteria bacterium]